MKLWSIFASLYCACITFQLSAADGKPEKLIHRKNRLSGGYLVVMKENRTELTSSMQGFSGMMKGRGRPCTVYHNLGIMSVQGASESELSAMLKDPEIDFIEEKIPMHAAGASSQCQDNTYTVRPTSWGLDRIDQKTLPLDSRMRVDDSNPSGSDVITYVLDTGVYAEHPDFEGRVRRGPSFMDHEPELDDFNGHGTHCAGVVGGYYHGVNKNAQIVAVKVLDRNSDGDTGTVSSGLDWVAQEHQKRGGFGRAKSVASLSVGGGRSEALNAAVRRAYIQGVVVVVAASNFEDDASKYSPASAPEAITVGASRRDDRRLWYSNYGTLVDIHAPGSDITSTWIQSSKKRRRRATANFPERSQISRYSRSTGQQCVCQGCDERRQERRLRRRQPLDCTPENTTTTAKTATTTTATPTTTTPTTTTPTTTTPTTTTPTTTTTTTTTIVKEDTTTTTSRTPVTDRPVAEGPTMDLWGTSMACPHVAGAVSLYLQRQPPGVVPPPEIVDAWLKLHATYTLNVDLPFDDSGTTRAILQVPQC